MLRRLKALFLASASGLGVTLGLVFAMSLMVFYFDQNSYGEGRAFVSAGQFSVTITMLMGIPYMFGAVISLLSDPDGDKPFSHSLSTTFYVYLGLMAIGFLVLREAVICMVIAAPVLLPFVAIGIASMRYFLARNMKRGSVAQGSFLLLPLALLTFEASVSPTPERVTVQREIVIDAPPEVVWPLLLSMPDINEEEGHWTFTQSVMGVPRPVSAEVKGEGVGAVRAAYWQNQVYFEEHIIEWDAGRAMRWSFAFPDDSVARYTDAKIGPDTIHMRIFDGGYRIEPMHDGRTRLILDTRYDLSNHLSIYAKLWGEVLLGDILGNVLVIVKDRAEASKSSPLQ
ncbi:hypothetical protein RYZ27_04485 [Hyphomonas sp. FCG-A18]|uniref:SRPBCC family protein n=1 Tax=Hyphomonas sp. FCG-A18 TaxID=3080019 RepID=UPI002B2D8256|nr:hypothetical protein RYZ27_04485 [Hyphomonas sp. FCG-A18]